jgi:MFS family permease
VSPSRPSTVEVGHVVAGAPPGLSAPAARVVLTSGAVNTFASLPRFLIGALAVFIAAEMGLSETQVGASVSAAVAVSALASVGGGRIVQRIGAYRSMTLVMTLSAIVALGVALTAHSYAELLAWMCLSGAAMAMVHPSTSLAISGGVPPERQGLAFGIKQSAPTGAALLAGVAVPVVGLTVGWRWAYVGAAAGALLVVCVIPRRGSAAEPEREPRGKEGRQATATLLLLAVGMGFATAAVSVLTVFYVLSAVDGGVPVGVAGLWLAAGSLASILGRLLAGWTADRHDTGSLRVIAYLMLVGAIGFVLLSQSDSRSLLLTGTALAFVAGWGWPGLFQLVVTRSNEAAPAAATGVTQTGAFVGSAVGPLLFGWLADVASYGVAWCTAAAALVISAFTMLRGHRALQATGPGRSPGSPDGRRR